MGEGWRVVMRDGFGVRGVDRQRYVDVGME